MKGKLLFVYNPLSGKGLIKNNLSDIMDVFVKAGYEVSVHTTQFRGDATAKCIESAGEYDRIVCAGGDGTLDEVITGIMESGVKCPVGYIPAGSTNDFGNSVGIASEMIEAAHTAVGDDSFLCDIGRFGDDYFVYVAAFGIFTDASYATDQNLKNILGHAAYVLQAISTIWDIKTFRMQVEYDGHVIQDEFVLGMITNSKSVGGWTAFMPQDVSLNDGLFEVILVRTPKNPIELNEIMGFITGLNTDTQLVYRFIASSIKLTAREKVAWTLDGEFGGERDTVLIQNLPKAIEIIA